MRPLFHKKVHSTLAATEGILEFVSLRSDFKIKLGVSTNYVFAEDNQKINVKNEFVVFPNIEMSYQTENSSIVPYVTIESGMTLNTLESFSMQNPYVSNYFYNDPFIVPRVSKKSTTWN